jgi:hypothetical protein
VTVESVGEGIGAVDSGLVYELQRRRFDVRVGEFYANAWPDSRVAHGRPADVSITVAVGRQAVDEVRRHPERQELASYEPVPGDEWSGAALPVVVVASPPPTPT